MKQFRKNSEYAFLAFLLIVTMQYAVLGAEDDKDATHTNDNDKSQQPKQPTNPPSDAKPAGNSSAQPLPGNQPAVTDPKKFVKGVFDSLPLPKAIDAVNGLIRAKDYQEYANIKFPDRDEAFRKEFAEKMKAIPENERQTFLEGVGKGVVERQAAQEKVEAEKVAASTAAKVAEEKKLADQRRLEEQQALQNAFLQGASRGAQEQAARSGQNGGAGGGGGSGSGNGSGKGSITPKSDSPSLPKAEGISDALDKFKHGNDKAQSISDTRGLLQNQNNSGSGDLKTGSEKSKEDGKSPFDISPKTPKNDDSKQSKKEGGADGAAADPAAIDPGALALNNGNQNIVLSGPTSVPQLAPPRGGGEGPGGGGEGEGGGGGGGGTPPIKGGPPSGGGGGDSGFLGGGDPFKSVGSMEFPELPPPIRKVPFESGGGSDGGGSGSGEGSIESTDSGGVPNKGDKKSSLINELILTSDNPRARGLGIMAYVGVQTTDLCTRQEAKNVGVCRKRFEMRLDEKLRLKVSPVSASTEEVK